MTKLKWMVNVNLYDNETGSFWKGPGMDPKAIQTEVFMLPCASSIEKEGSLSKLGTSRAVEIQGDRARRNIAARC